MDDEVLSVRIPRKDIESMDRLVREGGYINRSDFVRHAVRALLEGSDDGSGIARIGMNVEGGVPNAPPRRAPRGVRR